MLHCERSSGRTGPRFHFEWVKIVSNLSNNSIQEAVPRKFNTWQRDMVLKETKGRNFWDVAELQ